MCVCACACKIEKQIDCPKYKGGKRVGYLPSPLSPAASLLCEVAIFLSHSVVVQRTVPLRNSMCVARCAGAAWCEDM